MNDTDTKVREAIARELVAHGEFGATEERNWQNALTAADAILSTLKGCFSPQSQQSAAALGLHPAVDAASLTLMLAKHIKAKVRFHDKNARGREWTAFVSGIEPAVDEVLAALAEATPDSADGATAGRQPSVAGANNPQPPSAEGWRDIESAPRDGTAILITRPTEYPQEERCHVVRWDDDEWRCHDGKFDSVLRGNEPTHWMPLPADAPKGGDA